MQKKVGNALYVFDTTPFTITEDTDSEVIYVQNECLKGYLELNTELESKIKTFNQWLLCVNAPWADGGTTEPTQNYHLLTIPDFNGVQSIYVEGYDTNLPPGGIDYEWFYNFNSHQIDAGMIDGAAHNKIYCNPGAKIFIGEDIDSFETVAGLEIIDTQHGQKYGFIMGDSDMTVDFSYTLKPKYHVSFSEDSTVNDGSVEISDTEQYVGKNVYIIFNGGASSSTITVTSNDVELTYDQHNDEYYFAMPGHDVTIKAVYATEQPQNHHLLTVSNPDRLYVTGYDAKLPPGDATHAWFKSFNQFQRDAKMIDAGERNKIYCNAGAKVFINNDINGVETVTGLEIIDTQWGQRYGVIMGDSDMTVDFSYTLKPTYHVNFSTDSNASADIEIHPQDQFAGSNVYIIFKNNQSSSTITITSSDVELTYDQSNDEYSFVMPEHDVTIKAVYANA